MRYAIFSDIHANLEALQAVLNKIDEIAKEQEIDQIWFLGDLVGYGPNPNECIRILRERTEIIIAGNHDWAAVGKLDLEDFSPAARISAEWTAQELSEENAAFLKNLPERLDIEECTLVHGSPFGPLWEYLTSEVLAERSFSYFRSRYCFVGHTHIPLIFQQPDIIANAPTHPLSEGEQNGTFPSSIQSYNGEDGSEGHTVEEEHPSDSPEVAALHAARPLLIHTQAALHAESAYVNPHTGQTASEGEANILLEGAMKAASASSDSETRATEAVDASADTAGELPPPHPRVEVSPRDRVGANPSGSGPAPTMDEGPAIEQSIATETGEAEELEQNTVLVPQVEEETNEVPSEAEEPQASTDVELKTEPAPEDVPAARDEAEAEDIQQGPAAEAEDVAQPKEEVESNPDESQQSYQDTSESLIVSLEDRLNSEIEELLALLGLSESMVTTTNEMIIPPEGHWDLPDDYRAIINPGGVGQPRDGDPRAAFMIYDSETGFEFYRVPYDIPKTQEKIIKAGLPHYLAARLGDGR